MTMAARNKLVNDMIRENPDSTIKDFVEAVKEFDAIRKAANQSPLIIRTVRMGLPKGSLPPVLKSMNIFKAHFLCL